MLLGRFGGGERGVFRARRGTREPAGEMRAEPSDPAPGDRFCPPTRTTSVKLKDWMRANDFPLHTRDRTPLVCVGAEVLAVYPGAAASAAAVASAAAPGGSTCGSVLRVVVDSVTL